VPEAPLASTSPPAGLDACPTPFACSWVPGSVDAAWIHVSGEVDLATSPKLRETLKEAQHAARLVVLDLREVAFMDSSSVHTILDASADAGRAEGRLLLVRGPANVERILTLTRVGDRVQIVDLDPSLPPAHALLSLARGNDPR
jgi:anti-sigma B factor antagonist